MWTPAALAAILTAATGLVTALVTLAKLLRHQGMPASQAHAQEGAPARPAGR